MADVMATVKEKMQRARELVKAKNYDEARQILETIDHPKATEWLNKIDTMSPPKPQHRIQVSDRFKLLERIAETIFFIRPQSPRRSLNFYRVFRAIVSIATILSALWIFLILVVIPEENAAIYSGYIIISCIFFPLSLYLFRWFLVLNKRYKIVAENKQQRANKIGASFYLSYFSFALLLISVFSAYYRQTTLNNGQESLAIAQRATNEAVQATQAIENAQATQTATLWTLTPSDTPTMTFTPSLTPLPSDTPFPTDTPLPTATITPSPTITQTPTLQPTTPPLPTSLPSGTTYYANNGDVRVRACPDANDNERCSVVDTLSFGDEIGVIRSVTGSRYSGSTTWYEANLNGQLVYVHSALVSRTKPVPQIQTNNTSSNTTNQTNTSSQTYTCNCSKTCGSMSCQEAYFQLNQCGCSARDSDHDGVPCESVCPGG